MLANESHRECGTRRWLHAAMMMSAIVATMAARPTDADAQILKKIKQKAAAVAGSTSAKADSLAAKADSVAKSSSKVSQAASKLTTAADAIQQKTGISKGTMVDAALAASGAGLVGAALHPGSSVDKASAGLSAAKAVVGAMKDAKGMNVRGADASLGVDVRGFEGVARSYQDSTALQQQLQWLEMMSNDSTQPPMARLAAKQQLDMYRLAQRAQQGDTTALRQLMEMQRAAAAQWMMPAPARKP